MDPVQEAQTIEAGTPEHDAGLVQTFDDRQKGQQPSATQRPANVPEKFWDAAKGTVNTEALLASYGELERGRSKSDVTPEAAPDADETEQQIADAGLDFDDFARSYAENGELTAQNYADLEAAGFPRDMVDSYIAGQEALGESLRADILSSVGGEEAFKPMVEWASQNLDERALDAYNRAVDSRDPDMMRMAVEGLKARYERDNGVAPNLVGGTRQTAAGDVYRSTQELTADMRDPRYAKDPAFRSDVEAKLARSKIM
jgi:hypothetical protein